jgi:hypothetical protein
MLSVGDHLKTKFSELRPDKPSSRRRRSIIKS